LNIQYSYISVFFYVLHIVQNFDLSFQESSQSARHQFGAWTRHSVWNSLPKNVAFSTLTSFRYSIQNISKSPIKILGTQVFGGTDGNRKHRNFFTPLLNGPLRKSSVTFSGGKQ